MYWLTFHVLKYVDIVAFVLVAGYACYEHLYAWAHDTKVDITLITKLTGWSLRDKDRKELVSAGFLGLMFAFAMLFVAGILVAFTWPVSVPALVLWATAWQIRKKIREKNSKESV